MSQFYESTVYIPSFGDIRRLIELASSHERTQPVGELAYIVASTGIRIGELVNLRVTDIVADMYLVRIASKSSPTDRYVPLSPRALQSLASLHMRFPESELVLGDKSHSYLHTLVHRLHVLACNMGAQSMRLHSLRRAMLQHLHSLGKTLREEAAINDVAGHANLAVKSSGSASDVETNLEIAKRLLKDLWAMLDLNEA
jgi:integrase